MDDYQPRKVTKKNQSPHTFNNERPLSVYDNLTTSGATTNNDQTHQQIPTNSFAADCNFDRAPNKHHHHGEMPKSLNHNNNNNSYDQRQGITKPISNIASAMRTPAPTTNTSHSQQPINGRVDDAPDGLTSLRQQTASHYNGDDHHHHQPNQQQQQQHSHQPPSHMNNNLNNDFAPAKPIAQYENVAETIKLRNSFRTTKPVISDAKSSFFGLAPPYSTSTPTAYSPLAQSAHHDPSAMHQQSFSGDRAPLITSTPLPAAVPTKSNGEYQNIPSNAALFQHRNTRGADAPAPVASWDPAVGQPSPSGSETSTRSATSSSAPPANDQIDAAGKSPIDRTTAGDHSQQSQHFLEASKRMSEHNPSQAVYMTTTVPQNIKGSNIAGRHTPTRTSLRHSRMIVVNKNYQAPRKPNPLNISHPFLAKLLLIVQLATGILITSLAIWVLLWAPNTRTRDNPYWSGITLIIAAILGLVLIEFRRQPRQKLREHCFTFLRLNSTTLSVLAMIMSFGAFVFATIHLDNVTSSQTVCMPSDIFTSSNAFCICLFGANNGTAEALELRTVEEGRLTAGGSEFQYRDLSCSEVRGAWKYILFAFTLLNMIAFIVSFLYLMMLCFTKRRKDHGPSGLGVVEHSRPEATGTYAPVRSVL